MTPGHRSYLDAVARPLALVAAGSLLLPAAARGQDGSEGSVTEQITALAEDNAAEYLRPVAAGLGAGLSSGFFESATAGSGVTFRVGVQAAGSLIPEDREAFDPVLPEEATFRDRTFTDPYAVQGDRTTTPTAAGEAQGVTLEPTGEFRQAIMDAGENPEDFQIAFPDGLDVPGVPLGSARATLGLPSGTSVTASVLPEIDLSDDVGPVSSFGIGARQSLTHFASNPPVEVAVAAEYQSLSLGEIVDATGKSASLIVSRDLDLITVFASGAIEDSDVDVEYTFEGTELPGQPASGETLSFPEEGESYPGEGSNSSTFTGGLHLDVFVARLTVSYTAAEYDVLRAGLSFGG